MDELTVPSELQQANPELLSRHYVHSWHDRNSTPSDSKRYFVIKGSSSQRVGVFLPVTGKGLFIKFKQVNDNF